MTLKELLCDQVGPIVLDGGLATELDRRGVFVGEPLWTNAALMSERNLGTLSQLHYDYAIAGAQVVSLGTLRLNPSGLRRSGVAPTDAARLANLAVEAGDRARSAGALLAWSMTTVEDCYRPDLRPRDDVIRREVERTLELVAESHPDVVLLETLSNAREATLSTRLACRSGICDVVASFTCGPEGDLLSGEDLVTAASSVLDAGAALVAINCSSLVATTAALEKLLNGIPDGPFGAYPNNEGRGATVGRIFSPAEYADGVLGLYERFGLRFLGGCCGTAPAHVRALRKALSMSVSQGGVGA